MKKIGLLLVGVLLSTLSVSHAQTASIFASQIGYRPDDSKYFLTTSAEPEFSLIDQASGEVVYTGQTVSWGLDADSQLELYRGSFDDFSAAGTYTIQIEGVGESAPFAIGPDVYNLPVQMAAHAFYLQRSGIEIHDSGLDHGAGHMQTTPVLWDDPSVTVDIWGGWYDAGDYGRYIPNGAVTTSHLLYAYRANPDFFADDTLQIPESGNGLPDLLDEIRWELDWMLRMQLEDGAVYHKVTTRDYPDFGLMPDLDTAPLYVFGPTSADTAYFAAVMAQAASIYQPVDPEYAATCLSASQRAWEWLDAHPEQVPPGGFQNPSESEYPMQGGYDLIGDETGHRMWAAGQLFNTTRETRYQDAYERYLQQVEADPSVLDTMSWANSYGLALAAYLSAAAPDPAIWQRTADLFQPRADEILEVTTQSGFGVALQGRTGDYAYVWGSNQSALSNGLYLMLANELFPNPAYVEAARAQVQYIFGINPLGQMYFTGLGANPILHPHHTMSYGLQQAVPGLVGEGANGSIDGGSGGDAVLEALWTADCAPALCYADDWESWATNEPTIDANAAFVALASYFAAAP
jgi:endoglucanase